MAITSFKIQTTKAISLAECENVPKVMVIAGPNGVGKSTLLYEISQKRNTQLNPRDTKILYQPPHRALRKTTVQRRWLGGQLKWLSDVLSLNDVSGYEGLSIQYPNRTPDNVDEAGSTIKYTLGKIENRRQTILAELVDRHKRDNTPLETIHIPDIYDPLKRLTQHLLPHLTFYKIDFQNEDNIRCIWKRKDDQGEIELDIDDLSSGEKSIIILFLPLLENDVNQLLKSIEKVKNTEELLEIEELSVPDRVFIIDEPELHLHPDLQSKILSYIRSLTKSSNVQFIISTHSPTILDQALDDELYVFSFKSDNQAENQLKKVASNIERLEALKQLAGDTYLVTTGRSIICIEGDADTTKRPADIRLFQILYPRSTAYTFIPTGGKGEVIKIVSKLREFLPKETFGIKIFGITDNDQGSSVVPDVHHLPVCMIENLLIEPEGLLNYLHAKGIQTFSTIEELNEELHKIITDIKNDEVSYRVMRMLSPYTVRIKGSSKEEVQQQMSDEMGKVGKIIPEETELEKNIEQIKETVERIIADGKALQQFRGKAILQSFHVKHIAQKNISFSTFCYELAEKISETDKISLLLDPLFDQFK